MAERARPGRRDAIGGQLVPGAESGSALPVPSLKAVLRDEGLRDGRLRDARHTAATMLLILSVPDVVIDAITGWERGRGEDARSLAQGAAIFA